MIEMELVFQVLAAVIFASLCVFILFCRWVRRPRNDPSTESCRYEGSVYMQSSLELPSEKNVVAIDCETVGCVPPPGDKRKEVPIAAHCAIVDYNGKELFNEYICPHLGIKNWKGFAFKKLTIKCGMSFDEARNTILDLLKGNKVVVHHYHHDFGSCGIKDHILQHKIRDTSTCPILRKKANVYTNRERPYVKLKLLAKKLLGNEFKIQAKRPHNPLEDARAAMKLYHEVEEEWERDFNRNNIYTNADDYESDSDTE